MGTEKFPLKVLRLSIHIFCTQRSWGLQSLANVRNLDKSEDDSREPLLKPLGAQQFAIPSRLLLAVLRDSRYSFLKFACGIHNGARIDSLKGAQWLLI